MEARAETPFSYGAKLVADREALTQLLQSVFRQLVEKGADRFILRPIVDVEVAALVGDDEAALRAALESIGVAKISVVVGKGSPG
jgi:hypothetical protein